MYRVALLLVLALGLVRPASADVLDVGPNGFAVRTTLEINATPDAVFRTLTEQIGRWWNPDHSYSHDGTKLRLEARPGGCFCETMPNGGVQHLVVTHVMAPNTLVLRGGLGPLGSQAVEGAMEWALDPREGRTTLTLMYNVGGYVKGGFAELAPAVDAVLAQQAVRLKSFIETGRPK